MLKLKSWNCIALATFATACSSSLPSDLNVANRPKGYQTLCKIGETCSIEHETRIAFGASGKFVYKDLNGTFVCEVETFGSDPYPEKAVKECSIPLHDNDLPPPQKISFELHVMSESNQVVLKWKAPKDSLGVTIMRDSDENPEGRIRIATLPPTATSYQDNSVAVGKQYWYWVKSNQSPESFVESKGVSIEVTPPTAPSTGDNDCVAGATIKDRSVDCGGKTIGLSCSADNESQPPVLTLINASVKNLRIAANGGSDGIHCNAGNCTLENVVWEDICEDAATNKSEGGTLTIIGGSAYNDATGPGGKPDKVFQHNSKNSTTIVTGGFTLKGQHGKLWRSCGDCKDNGGPRKLMLDDVTIEGVVSAGVAGANRNYGDKVQIRNLKIKNYSRGKPSICDEYIGVNKGEGSSKKMGEFFSSVTCDVTEADITAY